MQTLNKDQIKETLEVAYYGGLIQKTVNCFLDAQTPSNSEYISFTVFCNRLADAFPITTPLFQFKQAILTQIQKRGFEVNQLNGVTLIGLDEANLVLPSYAEVSKHYDPSRKGAKRVHSEMFNSFEDFEDEIIHRLKPIFSNNPELLDHLNQLLETKKAE